MKKCYHCKELKPLDAYYQKKRSSDGLQGDCKLCVNKAVRKKQIENTLKLREQITQLKRNPCTDCGLSYPPICMDYDHKEGSKDGRGSEVSNFAKQGRIMRAMKEIASCELVCSNCHRIRTAKRKKWLHLL